MSGGAATSSKIRVVVAKPAHMTLVPRVVKLLDEQGVDDVLVTVGGTIPADDIPELKRLGVAGVFTPGATDGEHRGRAAESTVESTAQRHRG